MNQLGKLIFESNTSFFACRQGVSGSNVAQEAADIVLKTDNFSGVVETIKWGRHIYETVLKFLQFQFTATWVTLIVLFIGAIVFQVIL